jgi:cation-transporting ATPase E
VRTKEAGRLSPERTGPVGPVSERWLQVGLSAADVAERVDRGEVNRLEGDATQSWLRILRRNALTRLNFLLVALGVATLATGSGPDATFLAVAVINTVVGATQEARAKRTLDALAVINAPKARVVRAGEVQEIAPEDVVLDDLLDLRPGDQLIADAEVVAEDGELDESLATGESDPVAKQAGDQLLSGSWVVAGTLRARATRVGADSFANQLAQEARRFNLASSELMAGINKLLLWLSWLMVVIAPILLLRELQTEPWRDAVRLTVAGLVGMIPEGLVLLTTLAFLAAAVRLGRNGVLIQELPAVETLARVDSLCVDKTGTLTESGICFKSLVVRGADRTEVEMALAGLAAAPGANATMAAVLSGLHEVPSGTSWEADGRVPFSSALILPAPPSDVDQRGGHRHSRLLPGPGAQLGPLPARFPAAGPESVHPGRAHHRGGGAPDLRGGPRGGPLGQRLPDRGHHRDHRRHLGGADHGGQPAQTLEGPAGAEHGRLVRRCLLRSWNK